MHACIFNCSILTVCYTKGSIYKTLEVDLFWWIALWEDWIWAWKCYSYNRFLKQSCIIWWWLPHIQLILMASSILHYKRTLVFLADLIPAWHLSKTGSQNKFWRQSWSGMPYKHITWLSLEVLARIRNQIL